MSSILLSGHVASSLSPADSKGVELVKEANLKLSKFSIFTSKQTRLEEGVELLKKACSQFKMNKNWKEAGDTYVQIAELYETKLLEPFEAGASYEAAAKAYKNCALQESIRCFQLAAQIKLDNNDLAQAGKMWKEIATLHQKEHQNDKAFNALKKASTCFSAAMNQVSAVNQCHVLMADLAVEMNQYKEAVELYEKLIQSSLDNSSFRWSVKDYQFKSLLCQFLMASQSTQTKQAPTLEDVKALCDHYREMNPLFDDTRESKLILDLLEDFKEEDVNKFTNHVFEFDQVIKLDHKLAKILLDIKQRLEKKQDDLDVDLR